MTFKEYIKTGDVSDIRYNTNQLHLSNKELTDLNGIEEFTQLKVLYLSRNHIKDIEPLKYLINLRYLNVGENNITDIESLKDLINLKELFIYKNSIKDISCLKNLDLIRFSTHYNFITDISVIYYMNNLEQLSYVKNPLDIIYNKYEGNRVRVNWIQGDKLKEFKLLLRNERRKRLINQLSL